MILFVCVLVVINLAEPDQLCSLFLTFVFCSLSKKIRQSYHSFLEGYVMCQAESVSQKDAYQRTGCPGNEVKYF